MDFGDTVVLGNLGAVIGNQMGYWIGRSGGRPFVLRWGRYALITPERLGHAEAFFARHGGSAVFLARFVVDPRIFGALVAGTSRMPWGRSPSTICLAVLCGLRRPSRWVTSYGQALAWSNTGSAEFRSCWSPGWLSPCCCAGCTGELRAGVDPAAVRSAPTTGCRERT